MEKEKLLNQIGKINININFNKIFDKNFRFLISNLFSDSHYFEMTGESMYYALLEQEEKFSVNNNEKKKKIAKAIIERKKYCGGILHHESFNGEKDTQLRSTSAAIRTLLVAEKDGFIYEKELLEIVDHHFSYYFNWGEAVWFCHDTSEKEGVTPKSHLKTSYWKKEKRNTLTLNTHLDSLTTLLLFIEQYPNQKEKYKGLLSKSILAVNKIIKTKNKSNYFNSFLQKIDDRIFNVYLKKISNPRKSWILYQKIVHPLFFKVLSPTMFFKNGYIGRDMSVANIHVDYFLVNITDFLRLLSVYNSIESKLDTAKLNTSSILEILEKSFSLLEINENIKAYAKSTDLGKAWYAEAHYLYSFYSKKHEMVVNEIKTSELYNLETTIFAKHHNKY